MKGIKRFISLLLAVALVSGVMPVGGFSSQAAETDIDPQVTTKEERETIRKNINTYSWAKKTADNLETRAKNYVDNYETIYNLIVGEGLPRYYYMGHKADADKHVCLCKENTENKWVTDPLNKPWKVQCPKCEQWFPSNNFEEFYKLGLQDDGTFDRMKALEAHHEVYGYKPSTWENILGTYKNLEEGSDE